MKFLPIIIIALLSLFVKCEQPDPVVVDCTKQIDSLNKHWIDIVKNLVVIDTNYVTIEIYDTNFVNDTVYNFIDSVSIRYIDSVSFQDSLIFIDTLFNSLGELVEILPDSVRVDSIETWEPEFMLDEFPFITRSGDRGTRWAINGYPHQAMFYFDTVYVVTEIWVNTFGWDEGYTHQINLYYYADKIDSIDTKMDLWSKHNIFYTGSHLYLDVVGGKNSYTDLGGVRFFGYRK